MAGLRGNAIRFTREFQKFAQRMGMEIDKNDVPKPAFNIAEMSMRADEMHTGSVSFSMPMEVAGEDRIPLKIAVIGPTDQSLPQSRHFARMVNDIALELLMDADCPTQERGQDNKLKSLVGRGALAVPRVDKVSGRTKNSTEREVTVTLNDENVGALAAGMARINAYLDAHPEHEEAARKLLTKAAAIEQQHTTPDYSDGSKVAPTFRMPKVKHGGGVTAEPVFGISMETSLAGVEASARQLSQSVPGVSVKRLTKTFSFVEDTNHKEHDGWRISAEGDSLAKLIDSLVPDGKGAASAVDKSKSDSAIKRIGGAAPPPPEDSDDGSLGLRSYIPPRPSR